MPPFVAVPGGVFPRPLPRLPQRRVDRVRVGRIDGHVRAAGVLVLVEDLLERPAAVGRAINSAFLIGAVRMPEYRHEEPVGVARIDGDLRNLLPVAQTEMHPGLAGVGGFVDAVARREVGPLQPLAAPHVHDIGVRRRHRYGADRARRLIVEDRPATCARSRCSSTPRRCTRRCRTRSAGWRLLRPISCALPDTARSSASASRRRTWRRTTRPKPCTRPAAWRPPQDGTLSRVILLVYNINCPPFTSMVSPATKLAASDARNAIAVAHSAAVPNRPSGIVATVFRSISGVENTS